MIGFISSPFKEDNKPWSVRVKIRLCLEQMDCLPWTWEVEGEQELIESSIKCKEIISEAIRDSGFVVVVYMTRAGSRFDSEPDIPVYATEFEIIEAVRLGVPILFYVIRSPARQEALESTISVFGNRIILGVRPTYCQDEESLIERLRSDIQSLDILGKRIIRPFFQSEGLLGDLDTMHTMISANLKYGEFGSALNIIEGYSEVIGFIPRTRDEKFLFASYLGNCGKIYAHSRKYRKAIRAVRKSIRLLMECGPWNDLFVQVEALSGIYNMAGIDFARRVNSYAQRGIKLSEELAIRLRDSEASILRDHGEHRKALESIEQDQDLTPYTGAKFAHLLSFTGRYHCIDHARDIIEATVLPRARIEDRDLEYVLRVAGIVAMKDGHRDAALTFLDEAAGICSQKGALHTKMGIDKVRRSIIESL